MTDDLGTGLPAGAPHYRAFVGQPGRYDLLAALQFNLLTLLGLREYHSLLDIGCGSLRAGRLFIPYLLPGNYCGIEPERWLIEEAVTKELGQDLVRIKRPSFSFDGDFKLGTFGRRFDYVLAQSIFTHASPAQIARCLEEARSVMGPASVFAATYLKGDTDYDGSDWVYPDCVPYRETTMQRMAADGGLACTPFNYPHPGGVDWVLLFAR
jgi:SAM-dependent methyltransferase